MLDTGTVTTPAWYDDVVIPALLRAARDTYRRSIREQLAESGFADLPPNGAFVLGGLVNRGGDLAWVTRHLGVSRAAAEQLVNSLVARGYLALVGDDPEATVTERGRSAAARVKAGVEAVDEELATRLRPGELTALRRGLGLLSEIETPTEAEPPGAARTGPDAAEPPRAGAGAPAEPARAEAEAGAGADEPDRPRAEATPVSHFAPILPVTDLARSLRHYRGLGFTVSAYDGADEYGFAERDGAGLHLSRHPDLDPLTGAGAAYLYVRDADALAAEWSRPGIGGRTHPPTDTPYGLREGAHLDPDNNLIRFGSPIS
jgi:DNA-binding MarR family transcriptional regulator